MWPPHPPSLHSVLIPQPPRRPFSPSFLLLWLLIPPLGPQHTGEGRGGKETGEQEKPPYRGLGSLTRGSYSCPDFEGQETELTRESGRGCALGLMPGTLCRCKAKTLSRDPLTCSLLPAAPRAPGEGPSTPPFTHLCH